MTRRAMTILEILVVIGIIAVVIALVTGTFKGVREGARDAVSLSNLRSHGQAFSVYTNDYSDTHPFFTTPWELQTLNGGGLVFESAVFFDAHRTWHIVLADASYTASAGSDVFFPPKFVDSDASEWPFHTPYNYACTFIADPKYWNPYTRTGPRQYRATRASEVTFPGAKSLVVERWPYEQRVIENGMVAHGLPAVFCDGAARAVPWNERSPGYERGEGPQFVAAGAVHFMDYPPLLHTIDGVRGRDIR